MMHTARQDHSNLLPTFHPLQICCRTIIGSFSSLESPQSTHINLWILCIPFQLYRHRVYTLPDPNIQHPLHNVNFAHSKKVNDRFTAMVLTKALAIFASRADSQLHSPPPFHIIDKGNESPVPQDGCPITVVEEPNCHIVFKSLHKAPNWNSAGSTISFSATSASMINDCFCQVKLLCSYITFHLSKFKPDHRLIDEGHSMPIYSQTFKVHFTVPFLDVLFSDIAPTLTHAFSSQRKQC